MWNVKLQNIIWHILQLKVQYINDLPFLALSKQFLTHQGLTNSRK